MKMFCCSSRASEEKRQKAHELHTFKPCWCDVHLQQEYVTVSCVCPSLDIAYFSGDAVCLSHLQQQHCT